MAMLHLPPSPFIPFLNHPDRGGEMPLGYAAFVGAKWRIPPFFRFYLQFNLVCRRENVHIFLLFGPMNIWKYNLGKANSHSLCLQILVNFCQKRQLFHSNDCFVFYLFSALQFNRKCQRQTTSHLAFGKIPHPSILNPNNTLHPLLLCTMDSPSSTCQSLKRTNQRFRGLSSHQGWAGAGMARCRHRHGTARADRAGRRPAHNKRCRAVPGWGWHVPCRAGRRPARCRHFLNK